jgi:hypothetical protein
MSFRLRHEWTTPTRILDLLVQSCPHCGTLRAELPTGVHFVRWVRCDARDRVVEREPPCIEPPQKADARRKGAPSGWTLRELIAAGKATGDDDDGFEAPARWG